MFNLLGRRRFLAAAAATGALSAARFGWAAEDTGPSTARLNGWFETRYDFWLARSPMQQGYLGLKTDLDKWDDVGEARQQEDFYRRRKELADLRASFGASPLAPDGRLSYRVYEYDVERALEDHAWRHHAYPVNQMGGWQQEIPSFLMNIHGVETLEEAQAYVARLRGVGGIVDQVIEQMRLCEAAGVLAPKFSYANAIRDCRNVLTGAPFDNLSGPSPVWGDITAKIDALAIEESAKQKLRADAERAMVTVFKPAFFRLIALCEEQEGRATTDDGVWKHPDGEAYYASLLASHTTTTMTAAEIHAFGLAEVARIHDEMRVVMDKVGFRGDLKAFFTFIKTDPQFYYPQTPEGIAAYIARSEEIIDAMRARLDDVFIRKPRAKLVVKPVEAFREQSSTSAFYQSPGAYDGRPGTYYVNTFDMRAVPKYEMETLAYHEAIPGHHMQISIAQEKTELPRFRRFAGYSAYAEGWGLYCERLGKEMGFFQDPYADFGRLADELWRACRLVVDTGIHSPDKRWTRAQVVNYLTENTPNTEADITNSAERYIVDPGQATAYKIGMTKILELRETAKMKLGAKFDLREYHDLVLANGALPLTILADTVDAWVKEQLA